MNPRALSSDRETGCRVYTIVDLDNPEFPCELKPMDLSEELLEKYSVGDVIVEPQIRHASVRGVSPIF